VNDPRRYDKREAMEGGFFECSKLLGGISKIRKTVSLQKLFDENIVRAVSALNDKDSQLYLSKMKGLEDERESKNSYIRF